MDPDGVRAALAAHEYLADEGLATAVYLAVVLRRPLLLQGEAGVGQFEAFLLEILSDYAVTVPELGTFRAETPPVVIITSNRTRDVHDALKRRCLYHWVEHPDFEREVAIVRLRAPGVAEALAEQVAAAVEQLR